MDDFSVESLRKTFLRRHLSNSLKQLREQVVQKGGGGEAESSSEMEEKGRTPEAGAYLGLGGSIGPVGAGQSQWAQRATDRGTHSMGLSGHREYQIGPTWVIQNNLPSHSHHLIPAAKPLWP